MAQNYEAPAFFMVALLLIVAATPTAGTNLVGRLSAGDCNGGGAGISGVPVSLNCTGLGGPSITMGQGVTGVNGAINISLPNILNTVGSTLECALNLLLNQTVCLALDTVNGILGGVLPLVNATLSPVAGAVQNISVPLTIAINV